jgi:hypothetical protein
MLNVSEKTLRVLDRVRAERGIRTRAKALEVVLSEAVTDDEEILSAAESRRLKARLARAATEEKIPLSEIKKRFR